MLGYLGSFWVGLGKSRSKPGTKELRNSEFCSSTQRMGVRFDERLRDNFRRKWLKIR